MVKAVLGMVVVLAALSVAPTARATETVLGRWCWQKLPNSSAMNVALKIVVTDSGAVELRSDYFDGSSGSTLLREAGGDVYERIDSPSGDRFRLVRATGDLQVLDSQGLIGTARRLEIGGDNSDCLK